MTGGQAMVREISPPELAAKLKAGEKISLLDVRQVWEHELAALPNSVLIPLDELLRRVDEVQALSGSPVVVYCHHGVRSFHAAAFLMRCGLTDVASLASGIEGWSLEVDPSVPRY
jgi:rhodanese-related sulfurtransferase